MSSYHFPFKLGSRVVELGGGTTPLFRPNLDIMLGENVDYVCDLAEGIPLKDGEWDGIWCQFCLEHIRHAKVRHFIAEAHRILKPGGVAVFITANLYEQAKKLVETDEWNDGLVNMVFGGDPDYPGNYHHTGFSPKFAYKLFKEAGFYQVRIGPLAGCITDMLIEATKSQAQVEVAA